MDKNTDPVCGMDVDEERATGQSEHGGRRYYFCSEGCKEEFDNRPDRFIRGDTLLERERGGI